MGIAILILVVLVIGGAAWIDRRDRRDGHRSRGAGDMVDLRRERRSNLRSNPQHGIPIDNNWDKPMNERLKGPRD